MFDSFISKLNIPEVLDFPEDVTFGVEIEFENAKLKTVRDYIELLIDDRIINGLWKTKTEISVSGLVGNVYGGEAVSPILRDEIESYKQIESVCNLIKKCGGITARRCAGHIHIGSNILEDNVKYYSRLARIWTVFEKEIIRFGLGEDEEIRDTMAVYSSSAATLLRHIEYFESGMLGEHDFEGFARCFGFEKKLAISFYYLDKNRPFHTIEIRCPNGTLNPNIWKNNINFFVKLLLSCKDDSKDWDMIENMFQEEKDYDYCITEDLDFEKAKILAEFVFDNQLDIDNFMLQYKKDSKLLIR